MDFNKVGNYNSYRRGAAHKNGRNIVPRAIAALFAMLLALCGAAAFGSSSNEDAIGATENRASSTTSLTGSWESLVCAPPTSNELEKCDFFYLTLLQEGNAVCGQHDAGLAGASLLDEGYAGSVAGSVGATSAIVGIRSGRSGALLRARIEMRAATLVWSIVGALEPAKYPDVSSIPSEAVLRKRGGPGAGAGIKGLEVACKGAVQSDVRMARRSK